MPVEKRSLYLIVFSVVFLCVIVFIFSLDSVQTMLKEGYLLLQKAAVDGKNVRGFILNILAIVAFFVFLLIVLFFLFLPNNKSAFLLNFLFIFMGLVTITAAFVMLFENKIVDYLKTTYQAEQKSNEE